MKTIYKFVSIFLIAFILGSAISYTLAQSGNTFIIGQGIYSGAPSYTIFKEGSIYYAKNAYGFNEYFGANASQVINNALDNGKSIFLTKGEYLVTHSINLNDDNELFGEGYGTVIKATDGCSISSAMGIIQNKGRPTETGNDNIRIANLRVNGNNASQTVNFEGIAISHSIGVTIENVWVHNAPEIGISLNGGIGSMTSKVSVINAKVYLNEADGLQIDFGSSSGTGGVINIIGGRYYNNTNDGIKFSSSLAYTEPPIGELSVIGAEVDNNGNGGISILYTASNVKNVLLSSNFVHSNAHDGITLAGSDTRFMYASIFGNDIQNNGWCGIKVFVVNHTTISNNIIINNVQVSGGSYNYEAGIEVFVSNYVIISNNIITDDQSNKTQRFGIRLTGSSASSNFIRVIGNDADGNKEANSYVEGTVTDYKFLANIGIADN